MAKISLPMPPVLAGAEQNQITQLRDYLFQMSRILSDGMHSLDVDNFASGSKVLETVQMSQEVSKSLQQRAATLRALIISTATEIVKLEDKKFMTLLSSYMAKSEYGTLFEEEEGTYTFAATGLNEALKKTSTITNLDTRGLEFEKALKGDPDDPDDTGALGKIADLELYQRRDEASILLGWVDIDGQPSVGLALGHNFSFDATIPDSEQKIGQFTYKKLSTEGSYGALYTARGIEFYMNGNLVASWKIDEATQEYRLETHSLYVEDGNLNLDPWKIDTSDGFKILYVG